MSKTSETIVLFHEMKYAVVARLSERRSLEFRSHTRINPWNSNRIRFCDVFPCLFFMIAAMTPQMQVRQLMPHFIFLGFQIKLIVLIGCNFNGHSSGDRNAVTG